MGLFICVWGESAFALAPEIVWSMLVVLLAIACVTFPLMGMYRGLWRYASIDDLLNITKSATLVILLFLPLMFVLNRLERFRARSRSSNGAS